MALELVFECPRTLRSLRVGPLGKLLGGFCNWLLSHGYRRGTIRTHLSNVSHLNKHLASQRSGFRRSLNSKDIDRFFKAYSLVCRSRGGVEGHVRRVRYSINRFIDHLREFELFDPSSGQEIYQPLLEAYLNWMRHYQHASEGTLGVRCHSISQFLEWLGPDATPEGLSKLSSDRIEDFFISYVQSMGCSARRSMQSALRTFLRFCLHSGYVEQSLEYAVPTLRTYKLATVPRGLTDTQAQSRLWRDGASTATAMRANGITLLCYSFTPTG